MRVNYPHLNLPAHHLLDTAFLSLVHIRTFEEIRTLRSAYILGKPSPEEWDEWEIDVPF